jgi:hypothetical protein
MTDNDAPQTVISKDGTTIAFDQSGTGAAIIRIGGALEQRVMDSEPMQLATPLAQRFSVFQDNLRGHGDSTDTQPYAIEREIGDIDVLINVTRGSGDRA